MIGNMSAPLVSGFIVINQRGKVLILFVFIFVSILRHRIGSKSAHVSFGQIFGESVEIKIVVGSVEFRGGDVGVSSFAIPSVETLFNLL